MTMLAQSMQQFPWPKLVFLFVVIGFSLLSWILKQLQKQRELRRREIQRERMEHEALRTGRSASRTARMDHLSREDAVSSAAAEAAARRAARLEELRQRRQAALQSGQGTVRVPPGPSTAGPISTGGPGQGIDINLGGVILRIPGSAGPTVPGTRAPQPGRAGATGAPRRSLTPEQAAELRRRQAQKRGFEAKRSTSAESARQPPRGAQADQREAARRQALEQRRRAEARRAQPQRASEEGETGEEPVHQLVKSEPEAAHAPTKVALRRVVASLRGPGLRQAIILREILGPPISMR